MKMKLITGSQVRGARALLNWSQLELSKNSGVAIGSIRRIEANNDLMAGSASTFIKLIDAFTNNGIEFTGDGKNSVGITLILG
ncbi:helix-turn-helix domain-containing protein [Cysteiniphilum litorale]|uniref:helix-turn-helix domain-containing protein n=1 Tax=Cysteiniphilum litorale TaxID=2056700 RepID=UPI003F882C8D